MRRPNRSALLAGALAIAALGTLAACAARHDPPRTVAAVDLQRYAGRWYEIARLPMRFEPADCRDVTAEYTPRPDGRVGVLNTCRRPDGRVEQAHGTAHSSDRSNARLRVSFFWPFFGDYWVLALDEQYRWALVGSPDREYLWVLSRTPRMAPADYAAALAVAREDGFDLAPLIVTPQD